MLTWESMLLSVASFLAYKSMAGYHASSFIQFGNYKAVWECWVTSGRVLENTINHLYPVGTLECSQELNSLSSRGDKYPWILLTRVLLSSSALYTAKWSSNSTNMSASSTPDSILQNGQGEMDKGSSQCSPSGLIRRDYIFLCHETSIFQACVTFSRCWQLIVVLT